MFITFAGYAKSVNKVKVYPAPPGEILSADFKVTANNRAIPVYTVKVAAADNQRRFKAVDDLMHSADYFDTAAFCYLAVQGSAQVNVSTGKIIHSVKILPASAGVGYNIHQHSVSFNIKASQNFTVEINGDIVHSLHVFANPVDRFVRHTADTNLIYFGPGVHTVTSMVIGSNKTVYIAGGAIIRAVIGKDEKYNVEPSGLHNYAPTFLLAGHHIKLIGQGIIDASECPTHSRSIIVMAGSDITVEGIILKNSSGWTAPVRQCNNVTIRDIKIIGYRANTDGIDICNSSNITVDNCFVRTNDDLIVVKTFENQGTARHITVKNCILWNQLANALSLGAELRENVTDVLFTGCDIIHDTGREWSLHVFQCDGSTVSNIRFEHINIAETTHFISLWIGKTGPSLNKDLGYIQQVSFKNINVASPAPGTELIGGDNDHQIKDITFEGIYLSGIPFSKDDMRVNPFVQNVVISAHK